MKNAPISQKKLIGSLAWAYHTQDPVEKTTIDRAFFRNPRHVYLEVVWDGWLYPIDLQSQDAIHFTGKFNATFGPDSMPVTVAARFYSNGPQHAFIGEWIQEATSLMWWAELEEVDRFPDERSPRP